LLLRSTQKATQKRDENLYGFVSDFENNYLSIRPSACLGCLVRAYAKTSLVESHSGARGNILAPPPPTFRGASSGEKIF